jgi:hypothetical protein
MWCSCWGGKVQGSHKKQGKASNSFFIPRNCLKSPPNNIFLKFSQAEIAHVFLPVRSFLILTITEHILTIWFHSTVPISLILYPWLY